MPLGNVLALWILNFITGVANYCDDGRIWINNNCNLYFVKYIERGYGGQGPRDFMPFLTSCVQWFPTTATRFPDNHLLWFLVMKKIDKVEFQLEGDVLLWRMTHPVAGRNHLETTAGEWTAEYDCVPKDLAKYIAKHAKQWFGDSSGNIHWSNWTEEMMANEVLQDLIQKDVLSPDGTVKLRSSNIDDVWLAIQQYGNPKAVANNHGWINPATGNLPLQNALKAFTLQYPNMVISADWNRSGTQLNFVKVDLEAFVFVFFEMKKRLREAYDLLTIQQLSMDAIRSGDTQGQWSAEALTAPTAPTPSMPPSQPLPSAATSSSSQVPPANPQWAGQGADWGSGYANSGRPYVPNPAAWRDHGSY